tara:strand:- start:90 stop:791 length:702 start_codon:yes stop_codon:yes gene_type:complete
MAKIDLIIDSNERGVLCEAVNRRAKSAGLTVVRQALVVGDYKLGGALVEAKSVTDFFQSMFSGHLQKQLDNMDANVERFFLVVHGTLSKHAAFMRNQFNNTTPISQLQETFTGYMARIMADFDCQVFFTTNTSEAAQFIVKLHDKLHKPASRHGAQTIRRVGSNDLRLDMIMTIPGIGLEIAERILEKCGSIEEMCFPESLKQIKGLGEVRRKLIIKVLTSEDEVRQERRVRK